MDTFVSALPHLVGPPFVKSFLQRLLVLDFRRPVLLEGLKWAGKIVGKKRAKKFVWDNPYAVLKDKPILPG